MEDYLWYETTPTLSNKLFLSYILIEWGGGFTVVGVFGWDCVH